MSENLDIIWHMWFEKAFEADPKIAEFLPFSEIASRKIFSLILNLAEGGTVGTDDERFIRKAIAIMCGRLQLTDVLKKLELLAEIFERSVADPHRVLDLLKGIQRVQTIIVPVYVEMQHMEAQKFEKALELLTVVDDAIIRADGEEDLAEEVCRILVEMGGYSGAWMCIFEDGKLTSLHKYGVVNFDLRGTLLLLREAIENNEPVLHRNGENVMLLPLIYSNEVLGILALSGGGIDELSTLWRMAENVSYAISALRTRRDRIKTEKMYRTIVESTGTAIVVIDENRRITFANREVERQFGYMREHVLGKDFLEFLPDDEKRRMRELYEKMNENSFPNEISVLSASGERRNVVVTATPFPEGNKRVVASLIDVTKLREEEMKRKEAEVLYRTIFDSSRDAIVITDFHGTVIECNTAALELAGVEKSEVVGRNFVDLGILYEEDVPDLLQKFFRGFLEEKVDTLELRIRTKTGVRWIEVTPILLKRDGQILGYLTIVRDTTERRRYIDSLNYAIERLELLHEIDARIMAKDSLDTITSFAINEIARITGADVAVFFMPGRGLEKIYCQEDAELSDVCEFCRKTDIQRDVTIVNDISALQKLGVQETALINAGFRSYVISPLVVEGTVIGAIFLFSKKAGAFAEKDDLIKEVSCQLALSLHLHQLNEMREEARRQIDHNIEQFAILVDHIRNPLAAARGYLDVYVENGEVRDKIAHQLDRIVELVRKLERGWVESEKIREFLNRTYQC